MQVNRKKNKFRDIKSSCNSGYEPKQDKQLRLLTLVDEILKNFELSRQIFHHSLKEHPIFSKTAKFGNKIL